MTGNGRLYKLLLMSENDIIPHYQYWKIKELREGKEREIEIENTLIKARRKTHGQEI